MPPKAILPPEELPKDVIFDRTVLRACNPQRFEMEQLDGITLFDPERHLVVGYKDVIEREFWVRGHMPDFPLLPGVLMCESAAQLCSFYCQMAKLVTGDFVGFGGMDNVRFRGMVRPGDRMWLVGQTGRHNTRKMTFNIQGFVNGKMVFHGDFLGVPLRKAESSEQEDT